MTYRAFFMCVFLLACSEGAGQAQETALPSAPDKSVTENSVKKIAKTENHQPVKPIERTKDKFSCQGVFEQGGMIICNSVPDTKIQIAGITTKTDKYGRALIGFDRDEKQQIKISYILPSGEKGTKTYRVKKRHYKIQRIDGLPPSQVSTFTKAQLAKIRASSVRKKKGFASREQTIWFDDGFVYPLRKFTKTSAFGPQRILNGEPKRPHYGVDIAAPIGTPVYAPADGKISLADNDLYFEGAMVLIDHGQGLISMYLHLNDIMVKPGQIVKRGEQIGTVGSKGRSTGPHLCWRLKWRNRHLDPELLTRWPDKESNSKENNGQKSNRKSDQKKTKTP